LLSEPSLPVDTLERRAGIPDDRIIEAHGSFATQRCIECRVLFDDEEMKKMIRQKKVPRCKKCGGLVKPDIVFFGEAVRLLNLFFALIYSDVLSPCNPSI